MKYCVGKAQEIMELHHSKSIKSFIDNVLNIVCIDTLLQSNLPILYPPPRIVFLYEIFVKELKVVLEGFVDTNIKR